MKLTKVVNKLSLDVKSPGAGQDAEVTGCYVSDLLSDVMAHAEEGQIWLTLQVHPNIVAVAVLKQISAIVITNGRQPEEETLKKAKEESVTVALSDKPTFETAGALFKLLG